MNINGYSVLNFYVEENLGNREPSEFWVEARHDPNKGYLANKTNSINQNMRSTTAILVGVIYYVPPVINEITQEETADGKHVLELEEISLISTDRNNNTSQQSLNLPWLNQQGSNNNRSYRPPRGVTSRRRGRVTISTNMNQIPNNETLEENDT
ncbi:unnamed protein product [Rhizophagus irregularis]|nr:unnamed protein product [Rhizophagus irregularis]